MDGLIWLFLLGPFCLVGGLVLANFRRKDKGEPRKRVGVLAVLMILIWSACIFFTPFGAFCVNVGAWMVDTAKSGGGSAVFGVAVITLCSASLALVVFGVARDIWKDGVPDRPTFIAAMLAWIVAGIAFGVVYGPIQYDAVTVEVMKATVSKWSLQ